MAALIARGKAADALHLAFEGVAHNPGDPAWSHILAYALHVSGRRDEAVNAGRKAVALAPADPLLRNTLGAIELESGYVNDAVLNLREAVRLRPGYKEARFNLAQALYRREEYLTALSEIDALLQMHPDFTPAKLERAKLLIATDDASAAIPLLEGMLASTPGNPEILLNLAAAYQRVGARDKALAAATDATSRPNVSARELIAAAQTFSMLEDMDAAARAADRACVLAPEAFEILTLAGDVQSAARRYANARDNYRSALARRPGDRTILEKIASTSLSMGNSNEAANILRDITRIDPSSRKASMDLVAALESAGNSPAVRAELMRAIGQGHDDAGVLSMLAISKARSCEWSGLGDLLSALRAKALVPSQFPANPRVAFYFDQISAMDQRRWAENWANVKWPGDALRDLRVRDVSNRRIRVGFLSGELRDHPTSRLLVGMLEEHDRDRFEFFAYSHRQDDGSDLRKRIEKGFDRFVEVTGLSSGAIAERIQLDDVDILLDLEGYTRNSRLDVLAFRPATVQGHFLGYPGTSGAKFVDIFISDAVATPEGMEDSFTERVLRMPHSCQPTDPRRPRLAPPSRAQCGLRDDALVLCCFNQPTKITPSVFQRWCDLLLAIPKGCLWLLEFDADATRNLLAVATQRGVDPQRLVFAPRVAHDLHIARMQNADLAIDTFPCTSHTTASDALWAGVPLITAIGDTFASRMAASILSAAGLSDWVRESVADAMEAAIALVSSEPALAAARARAATARKSVLFDAKAFVRGFESLLINSLR